ncbi:MAG: hypothetical protein ABSE18_00760 [Minisyncoccia bacterium]|jgi:hypothetical protein
MKKELFGVLCVATLFALLGWVRGVADAQTSGSQVFITWQAVGSYVPASYKDKALPGPTSLILASVQVVSQGKLVDLKNQLVYWYQDGTYLSGGTGAQSITFTPGVSPPDTTELKVEIPNYSGGTLLHAVDIPIVQPVIVIKTPYLNNQFSDNPLTLTALPYFFNVPSPSALVLSWSVNGQTGASAENPYEAQITLPQGTSAGTTLSVALTAQNPLDATSATASKVLTYE